MAYRHFSSKFVSDQVSPDVFPRHRRRLGVRADIATKAGDDAAIKVCVLFDHAMADIPLMQTAILVLGHSVMGQEMPHATLCYVWDSRYPVGTAGTNPHTARVRYIVVNGPETPVGQRPVRRAG